MVRNCKGNGPWQSYVIFQSFDKELYRKLPLAVIKPRRVRKAQESPGEARKSPGEPRRAQESPGEPTGAQQNPGEFKKAYDFVKNYCFA